MGQRHVRRVAAGGDQDAADARRVVARVEDMPPAAEIDLHPGGEIHARPRFGLADLADVAGAVARRDVERPAEGDGEMGEVAADAALLAIGFRGGARRPRVP